MANQKIVDIYCPHCGKSLIRPAKHLMINGMLADTVLHFAIVGAQNRTGELELSLIPGDYKKHSTIPLHPEEEVRLIHAYESCRKSLNEKGLAKLLVQREGEPYLYEHFIVTKHGIECTLVDENPSHTIDEEGAILPIAHQKRKIQVLFERTKFKNTAEYLKNKLLEIEKR